MYTYQDFLNDNRPVGDKVQAIIAQHRASADYKIALEADAYDHQCNTTILRFIKMLYTADGRSVPDFTASNNRLTSNFFRRLNVQRNTYSLGNGVTFNIDGVKEQLGIDFDTKLKQAGYYALIHKVSFLFWNLNHVQVFKYTEFAPLWDEDTGALRGGVRYWQVDMSKPVIAYLYTEDGYTKLKGNSGYSDFRIEEELRPYIITKRITPDLGSEIIGGKNYDGLPIIPLYGSELKQSTLIGMQSKIDVFDMVDSGFANDLEDCSEIFWLISGAGGMNQSELNKFRDRLKLFHVAAVTDEEASVTTHRQELPITATDTFLTRIRSQIYEDFGGLDVHQVSANSTNDHLEAAYQPMDENADDYEYQIIDAVQALLRLIGVEDTPTFKRNKIVNTKEQTETILLAAEYLDDETVLNKLPFLTPDEVDGILDRKAAEDTERLLSIPAIEEDEEIDGNI